MPGKFFETPHTTNTNNANTKVMFMTNDLKFNANLYNKKLADQRRLNKNNSKKTDMQLNYNPSPNQYNPGLNSPKAKVNSVGFTNFSALNSGSKPMGNNSRIANNLHQQNSNYNYVGNF
mgnify:CR=1 FL=1